MISSKPSAQNQADDFGAVVHELARALGGQMVAVIGGANTTAAVAAWIDGIDRPASVDRENRVRLALRVVNTIQKRFNDGAVVRSWMFGANQLLGDESPIALIATHPLTARSEEDVLAAAGNFVM